MKTIRELQEERKRQKMTYDELAEKTGLSKSTITNIFCEYVQFPRADTIQAIERALGLNIAGEGWTAEERAAGVVDTLSVPITADEDEILSLLRELEEKKGVAARDVAQNVIISVLEGMINA